MVAQIVPLSLAAKTFRSAQRFIYPVQGIEMVKEKREFTRSLYETTAKSLRDLDTAQEKFIEAIQHGLIGLESPELSLYYRAFVLFGQVRNTLLPPLAKIRATPLGKEISADFESLPDTPAKLNAFIANLIADIEEIGPPPEDYGDAELTALNAATDAENGL